MNITSKTLMTMTAAMVVTLTGWAKTLPGVAPLSPEKLAQWRAEEMRINAPKAATKSDLAFYTGKPYDSDLNAYLFPFRNYSPDLCRWTVADPSGFPDGANNYCYAPCPTTEFDLYGLIKWNTLFKSNTYVTWEFTKTVNGKEVKSPILMRSCMAETNKGHFITFYYFDPDMNKGLLALAGSGYDFSTNCHGSALDLTYNNEKYWLNDVSDKNIILEDEYTKLAGKNVKNARVVDWAGGHTAKITGGMNNFVKDDGSYDWSKADKVTTYAKWRTLAGPNATTLAQEKDKMHGSEEVSFYE